MVVIFQGGGGGGGGGGVRTPCPSSGCAYAQSRQSLYCLFIEELEN